MRAANTVQRAKITKSEESPKSNEASQKPKEDFINESNITGLEALTLKQRNRGNNATFAVQAQDSVNSAEAATLQAIDAVESPVQKARQLRRDLTGLIEAALIPLPVGVVPQLNEKQWSTVYQFDTARRAGHLPQDFPGNEILENIHGIAMDLEHPCHEDAQLLVDVMTRPVDADTPSLEHFLSHKLQRSLEELLSPHELSIPPDPDSRTFNGIQAGILLGTVDYNSVGRTLLLKGAMQLIGIPSAPTDTARTMTADHRDREGRLERCIFSFAKEPVKGQTKLSLSDFNVMTEPDPLDDRDVYELSGPRTA